MIAKRHLLRQMLTEWRSNLWIVIELVIVGNVLWFIISMLLGVLYVRTQDLGYEMDDVYVADILRVDPDSPLFLQRDSTFSYTGDRDILINNLRANPYVELVGMGNNATSYNFSFQGLDLTMTDGDSVLTYSGNLRSVTPDVIRIYHLRSLDGKTTEQLADVIERGELLISDVDPNVASGDRVPETLFAGHEVTMSYDSAHVYRVGGLAHGLRRTDYEALFNGVIYKPLGDNWAYKLILRVKPGTGSRFVESLKDADKHVGNVYISNIVSTDNLKRKAHNDINSFTRSFVTCAVFLLIVIFLGFLGTFWFRTGQREGEIAIRLVCGATPRDIMRRFIGEGLMLLALTTVINSVIIYLLVDNSIVNLPDAVGAPQWLATSGIVVTTTVLAIMITAGIWAPARRAMTVNPAYALKDQ